MPAVTNVSELFHVFEADTAYNVFNVGGSDGFTVVHDGVNASDVEDTNTILMRLNVDSFDTPIGVGANLIKLMYGRSVYVPGGPHRVAYLCLGGAPTFTVCRRR
jgi:hypothetical protein